MIFTKRQIQEVIETHTRETGMTLLELSDRAGVPVKTLRDLLHGRGTAVSPKESKQVKQYFMGNGKHWPHWQTENHQDILAFCRQAQNNQSTGLISGESAWGLTSALLDYAFCRPDTLYLDMAKDEDQALVPGKTEDLHKLLMLPNGQEAPESKAKPKKLVILDHVEKLLEPKRSRLLEQKEIPMVMGLCQANNSQQNGMSTTEQAHLQLAPLSKKSIRSIASFHGLNHEGDVEWLHQKAKNFRQLQARVGELKQVLSEPMDGYANDGNMDVLFGCNNPKTFYL